MLIYTYIIDYNDYIGVVSFSYYSLETNGIVMMCNFHNPWQLRKRTTVVIVVVLLQTTIHINPYSMSWFMPQNIVIMI